MGAILGVWEAFMTRYIHDKTELEILELIEGVEYWQEQTVEFELEVDLHSSGNIAKLLAVYDLNGASIELSSVRPESRKRLEEFWEEEFANFEADMQADEMDLAKAAMKDEL